MVNKLSVLCVLIVRLLSLKPFDTMTPEGRAKERYRRATLTTLASSLARIVGVVMNLITIPLALHYLGIERYGLWITISSIISFLGFSDLGISNGLLNGISRAHGKGDEALAGRYVSTAFFFLGAIATVVGLAFLISYPFIPWRTLLNVRTGLAAREAGPSVAVFVGCFIASIPTGIAMRIQSGYQEGFTANFWSAGGSVVTLFAVILAIHARCSLPVLVLALAGCPILAIVLNAFVLFSYQRPWLRPRWSGISLEVSKELSRSSLLFFSLQVAGAISYSADNIILAKMLGQAAVTQYSIPSKLFGLTSILSSLVSSSLWPAYAEALARRDDSWVRLTLRRSIVLLFGIALCSNAALVVFGNRLISLWVGPTVSASVFTLFSFAVWSILSVISAPVAILLNAATVLRFQLIASGFFSLANLGLSIYLTKRIGILGVLYGSICTQLPLLVCYLLYTRRFLRRLGLDNSCKATAPVAAI